MQRSPLRPATILAVFGSCAKPVVRPLRRCRSGFAVRLPSCHWPMRKPCWIPVVCRLPVPPTTRLGWMWCPMRPRGTTPVALTPTKPACSLPARTCCTAAASMPAAMPVAATAPSRAQGGSAASRSCGAHHPQRPAQRHRGHWPQPMGHLPWPDHCRHRGWRFPSVPGIC
jgi:hypothetical protein